MFQRNILPPPSGSKSKPSKKQATSKASQFLKKIDEILTAYVVSLPTS
jgi:hypothetical protein